MERDGALTELQESLEKVLRHYGEPYFVRRDMVVGGMPVAALAEMEISEPKRLFGISSPGLKLGENRAGEYLIFLLVETLTVEAVDRMTDLLQTAQKELLRSDSDNVYTFFSVAALVNRVEPDAVKRLKRHRAPAGSRRGWVMARLAAVSPSEGKAWTNSEGKELGRLLLSRLQP